MKNDYIQYSETIYLKHRLSKNIPKDIYSMHTYNVYELLYFRGHLKEKNGKVFDCKAFTKNRSQEVFCFDSLEQKPKSSKVLTSQSFSTLKPTKSFTTRLVPGRAFTEFLKRYFGKEKSTCGDAASAFYISS